MKYRFTVVYTGWREYEINAKDDDEAYRKIDSLISECDCGELIQVDAAIVQSYDEEGNEI